MGVPCPGSGTQGRMIERDGWDDWNIVCPTCGAIWAGGSTLLLQHDRVDHRNPGRVSGRSGHSSDESELAPN
jgi:hypothetical protein